MNPCEQGSKGGIIELVNHRDSSNIYGGFQYFNLVILIAVFCAGR